MNIFCNNSENIMREYYENKNQKLLTINKNLTYQWHKINVCYKLLEKV